MAQNHSSMRTALGLSQNEPLTRQDVYAREAERLGYEAIWTNEGGVRDAFVVCARWATVAPGLGAGIAVVPVLLRTPMAIAMAAATLAEITGGRFTLGLGPASVEEYRRQYGTPSHPPLALMRDYVAAVRALLSGAPVEHEGPTLLVREAQLGVAPPPPRVPIFLGVAGPRMLRLAGEIADGVILNWCTAEEHARQRELVHEGARAAGRSPEEVTIGAYVRVCVDEDREVARRGLAGAALPYVTGAPGYGPAYRAHFERMGFGDVVARATGPDDLPPELLGRIGYFGSAEGAGAALAALSRDLDLTIVRVVPARPGPESVLAGIRAGAP
jgi:alkanesulfonate monooxygenase SsuD/methylene tetrahydromethanopterin reductase-like flavin-dependent oxidoreductase (luciferase family)